MTMDNSGARAPSPGEEAMTELFRQMTEGEQVAVMECIRFMAAALLRGEAVADIDVPGITPEIAEKIESLMLARDPSLAS